MEDISDFLDYIAKDNYNFSVNLLNLREEYQLFTQLNSIFTRITSRFAASKENEAYIFQLYYFVHYQMYFSVAAFMRCHINDSFASIRKSIDATFSAYKIITIPESAVQYREGNSSFQFVKNYFKKLIKNGSLKHVNIDYLVNLHELCSTYGSHADFKGFANILGFKMNIDDEVEQVSVNYFQFPRNIDEERFYFVLIIDSYWRMFNIYNEFFCKKFKICDTTWEGQISRFDRDFSNIKERYRNNPFNVDII